METKQKKKSLEFFALTKTQMWVRFVFLLSVKKMAILYWLDLCVESGMSLTSCLLTFVVQSSERSECLL